MASPFAARTLEMAMLRMMTLDSSLTMLENASVWSLWGQGAGSSLQSETSENGLGVLANDAGVAANLDLFRGLGDRARDNDDLLRGAGNGGGELSEGGDSGGGSAGSSGGSAVLAGVTSSNLGSY